MNYMLDDFANKNDDQEESITELKEIRIDNTKDYIYYENNESILHEEHIEKQDVIINIKGFESINETLAEELSLYDNEIVPLSEAGEGITCLNNGDLYTFPYREYEDTIFGDYISLVINDFTYDCTRGSRIENIKSYVIDKYSGEEITESDLLEEFGITEDKEEQASSVTPKELVVLRKNLKECLDIIGE